jgi:biotin carboxyl carrier protein
MKKKKIEGLVDFAILSMKYKTRLTKKFINRKKYEDPNPKHIFSYIPGTILEVFVTEGEEVAMGAPLLVFEAMKMVNHVSMPFDGKIAKINVKVGDRIPKNELMIEIE